MDEEVKKYIEDRTNIQDELFYLNKKLEKQGKCGRGAYYGGALFYLEKILIYYSDKNEDDRLEIILCCVRDAYLSHNNMLKELNREYELPEVTFKRFNEMSMLDYSFSTINEASYRARKMLHTMSSLIKSIAENMPLIKCEKEKYTSFVELSKIMEKDLLYIIEKTKLLNI